MSVKGRNFLYISTHKDFIKYLYLFLLNYLFFRSPLAPGLPFLAETTSGTAHKPFKVEFVPAD